MLKRIMKDMKQDRLYSGLPESDFPQQIAPRGIWMMLYVMEAFVIGLTENANKVAMHSKRITISDKDLDIVNYIERYRYQK
jgi:histone H3/H4